MRFLRQVLSLLFGPPLLVTGVLCAGAALGAQFGRTRDDWDILTHFAAVWGLAGVAVILAGLAFVGWVRPALIGVGVVAVGLSAALMIPEYLRDTGPTAPAGAPAQLKLIQFNVRGEMNPALDQTVAWIAAQHADVVTIEEATPRVRDLILARTGMQVACPHCDIMIFSRTTPVSTATPRRPDNASGANVARATFRDARGDYTVIATHAPWPKPDGRQQYEGRILASVLDGFPKPGLILTGDFNSTPWSFSRRREDKAFGLIRRDRALFSWPARLPAARLGLAPFPVLPIDHIYAGADWATVRIARGPRLGSDHYPLVVTLARRARF